MQAYAYSSKNLHFIQCKFFKFGKSEAHQPNNRYYTANELKLNRKSRLYCKFGY